MKFFWQKDHLPEPALYKGYREWVDSNVHWLIHILSSPIRKKFQYSLNRENFPRTYLSREFKPENILADIGNLLSIHESSFHFQWKDSLDGIVERTSSKEAEQESWMEVSIGEDGFPVYNVYLVSKLKGDTQKVLFWLGYQCLRIVMSRYKKWPEAQIDNPLVIHLLATYLGLGLIVNYQLEKSTFSKEGLWVQNWVYDSPMPKDAFAYSLALVAQVMRESLPIWIKDLPPDALSEFEKCQAYLKENPTLYTKETFGLPEEFLTYLDLKISYLYQVDKLEKALAFSRKTLGYVQNSRQKARAYNLIGFFKMKMCLYEAALNDFMLANKEDISLVDALDNMAFCYFKLRELEKAKQQIDKASKMDGNDMGKTHRNRAIYYEALGNDIEAEENFLAALALNITVDLLYYLYGEFLWRLKRVNKAKLCFEISAQNGEPEGKAALQKYFPNQEE